MVNHDGGSNNLEAVKDNHEALQQLGFTAEQIIRIVSHNGGSKNLEAVKTNLSFLLQFNMTSKFLTRLMSRNSGYAFLDYFINKATPLLSQHQANPDARHAAIERLCQDISSCLNLHEHTTYYQHPDAHQEDTAVVCFKGQPKMLQLFIKTLQNTHSKNNVAGEEDALNLKCLGDFVIIKNITAVFETLDLMGTTPLPTLDEPTKQELLRLQKQQMTPVSNNSASFFNEQSRAQRNATEFSVDWGKLRETPLNAEQNDGVLTELLQLMH
jgi:hypothetical protein